MSGVTDTPARTAQRLTMHVRDVMRPGSYHDRRGRRADARQAARHGPPPASTPCSWSARTPAVRSDGCRTTACCAGSSTTWTRRGPAGHHGAAPVHRRPRDRGRGARGAGRSVRDPSGRRRARPCGPGGRRAARPRRARDPAVRSWRISHADRRARRARGRRGRHGARGRLVEPDGARRARARAPAPPLGQVAGAGLIEAAEGRGAKLIVLGPGRTAPDGRLAPSRTALQVLQGAGCPVAIAPRGYREQGPSVTSARLDGRTRPRPRCASALPSLGATTPRSRSTGRSPTPASPWPGRARRSSTTGRTCSGGRRRTRSTSRPTRPRRGEPGDRAAPGDPGPDIVLHSDGIVDFLVTGSRGLRPFQRALVGSVSEQVFSAPRRRCSSCREPRSAKSLDAPRHVKPSRGRRRRGAVTAAKTRTRMSTITAPRSDDHRVAVELGHGGQVVGERADAPQEVPECGQVAGGDPRYPESSAKLASSRGISWTSRSVSGASRTEVSASSSAAVPPAAQATTGPKTGSLRTPTSSSTPGSAIGWTTKPLDRVSAPPQPGRHRPRGRARLARPRGRGARHPRRSCGRRPVRSPSAPPAAELAPPRCRPPRAWRPQLLDQRQSVRLRQRPDRPGGAIRPAGERTGDHGGAASTSIVPATSARGESARASQAPRRAAAPSARPPPREGNAAMRASRSAAGGGASVRKAATTGIRRPAAATPAIRASAAASAGSGGVGT